VFSGEARHDHLEPDKQPASGEPAGEEQLGAEAGIDHPQHHRAEEHAEAHRGHQEAERVDVPSVHLDVHHGEGGHVNRGAGPDQRGGKNQDAHRPMGPGVSDPVGDLAQRLGRAVSRGLGRSGGAGVLPQRGAQEGPHQPREHVAAGGDEDHRAHRLAGEGTAGEEADQVADDPGGDDGGVAAGQVPEADDAGHDAELGRDEGCGHDADGADHDPDHPLVGLTDPDRPGGHDQEGGEDEQPAELVGAEQHPLAG
jgi:hypothetical protein